MPHVKEPRLPLRGNGLILPKGRPGRTFRGVVGRSGRFATREIHDLAGERLVCIGRFMARAISRPSRAIDCRSA